MHRRVVDDYEDFVAKPMPIEKQSHASQVSYVVSFIEAGNLAGVKRLVPNHVKPEDLSGGMYGQKRTIWSIAEFHAKQKGDRSIADYINQFRTQFGGHKVVNPLTGRLVNLDGRIGTALQRGGYI
jgi:hypothetical protein